MKFTLHKLRIGDLVRAQVVEKLAGNEYIVSFQGDLVRVRNESLQPMLLNEKVLVRVLTVSPLTFQLAEDSGVDTGGATRINVIV